MEIKKCSSQIKEYTNIMNNPKRCKKFYKNNKHSTFITEPNTFYDSQQLSNKQFFIKAKVENTTNTDVKVKNSIHLIDHNYYTSPVTHSNNIKSRINKHLSEHNYFSHDTNIKYDKKKNNQHLLEHNYFLAVFNLKTKKEILHSKNSTDDIDEEENVVSDKYKVPVSYSILPGVRLNSQVYMDNLHHRYYKHSSRNNVIYLVCENQKNKTEFCPVMASISVDMNNNRIKTTGQHNHLPRQVDISMVNLRRTICLQATRSGSLSTPIKQLYYQAIITNPEGAKNYSLSQSQLSVRRMRRRRRRQAASII
uniref:FLYWCH-type domain-containing protein n=2 Tax=Schizaphis graminum TaxID=13262 RepID=A0A2S2P7X5_SCHGA